MAILKERALSQGKRMLVVIPCPALEAVTKASVPNSKALHPRWIQWAASLTSSDVTFVFDASLRSQEYLQYEFVHPAPLAMRPLEDFHCIIYTDGSAQVVHGSKHAHVSACAIVVGAMVNDEFKSRVVHTQTLGDCTAQLAELRALLLALEYADPSVRTLIVSDSYYCVQSYNENLFFWIQNDFRDSKGSTIKHKMIWVRVAELKEQLPLVFVIHTLGHQRVGVHAVGNSLADEAAKSAVSTYLVAAVTRSKSKIDDDILAAVAATEKGGKHPTGFPSKYTYHLSPDKVPYVKIPEVGERLIPNSDRRATLITAAHEGVASAHAGVSATVAQLQQRFWWRGLYKQTRDYVLRCDICQQIKPSTAARPPQTQLYISNKPLGCVYLNHCSPFSSDTSYKYILVAVDSCTCFVWMQQTHHIGSPRQDPSGTSLSASYSIYKPGNCCHGPYTYEGHEFRLAADFYRESNNCCKAFLCLQPHLHQLVS
ncbi:uncharacterized protein LOC144820264 [Lissotriton helveticus]